MNQDAGLPSFSLQLTGRGAMLYSLVGTFCFCLSVATRFFDGIQLDGFQANVADNVGTLTLPDCYVGAIMAYTYGFDGGKSGFNPWEFERFQWIFERSWWVLMGCDGDACGVCVCVCVFPFPMYQNNDCPQAGPGRHFKVSAVKKEGISSRFDEALLTLCRLQKP